MKSIGLKMNKTVWMCWFQGENDSSQPKLNRTCISLWKELNPKWNVRVLDNSNLNKYIPDFFEIVNLSKFNRNYVAQSELLRLMLLKKYGGIWVDSTVYPVKPLDDYIFSLLNHTGFFSYRFEDRIQDREIVSWFLATAYENHYLINKWLDRYVDDFLHSDSYWNTGYEQDPMNLDNYFEIHKCLSNLYDSDPKIKCIIDDMVQICQSIPHSALGKSKTEKDKLPSFMYKNPKFLREDC